MERNIEFTKEETSIGIFGDFETVCVIENDCKYTYQIICAFLRRYYKARSFYATCMKEEGFTKHFTIIDSKKKSSYDITINMNDITISIGNVTYCFRNRPSSFLVLTEMTEKLEDRVISRKYADNQMKLSTLIGGKSLEITTTDDRSDIVDNSIFRDFRSDSTINDLKNIYLKNIFPFQSKIERNNPTLITISVRKDNNDALDLRDFLFIKDGLIEEFVLSEEWGETVVSLVKSGFNNDTDIRISGYNIITPAPLEKIIESLYDKAVKLTSNDRRRLRLL